MSKLLQRLNFVAIYLLGGSLVAVLAVQIWPRVRALAQVGAQQWLWPKTLQVHPSRSGDPVKFVRIVKGGQEATPGKYMLPEISGDQFNSPNPLDEWLDDMTFVVKNLSSETIVSVGISVVLPARVTDIDCNSITGHKSADEPWCRAHPHWCDGGCPMLIHKTLSWGLIPAQAASGLEARYKAERRQVSPPLPAGSLLEGKSSFSLLPGQEMMLSSAGRGDSWVTVTDPRKGFWDSMNIIVHQEGIEEAKDAEPCSERRNSKEGCAFAEVSEFNVGLDIVYFADGTIWGNYGYGYARPNPDGIYTRVGAHGIPAAPGPASSPK